MGRCPTHDFFSGAFPPFAMGRCPTHNDFFSGAFPPFSMGRCSTHNNNTVLAGAFPRLSPGCCPARHHNSNTTLTGSFSTVIWPDWSSVLSIPHDCTYRRLDSFCCDCSAGCVIGWLPILLHIWRFCCVVPGFLSVAASFFVLLLAPHSASPDFSRLALAYCALVALLLRLVFSVRRALVAPAAGTAFRRNQRCRRQRRFRRTLVRRWVRARRPDSDYLRKDPRLRPRLRAGRRRCRPPRLPPRFRLAACAWRLVALACAATRLISRPVLRFFRPPAHRCASTCSAWSPSRCCAPTGTAQCCLARASEQHQGLPRGAELDFLIDTGANAHVVRDTTPVDEVLPSNVRIKSCHGHVEAAVDHGTLRLRCVDSH